MRVKDISLLAIFMALIFMMALVPFLGYIQIFIVGFTTIHAVVIVFILLKNEWKYAFFGGLFFGLSSMLIAFLRPSTPLDQLFQNPLVSVLPRVLFGLATLAFYRLFITVTKRKVVFYTLLTIASSLILLLFLNLFNTPSTDDFNNKLLDIFVGNVNLGTVFASILGAVSIILITIFSHIYRLNDKLHIGMSAFFGTLVHSILVLSVIAIYDSFTNEIGFSFSVIIAIITTNGVIEILFATLIAIMVVPTLKKYLSE